MLKSEMAPKDRYTLLSRTVYCAYMLLTLLLIVSIFFFNLSQLFIFTIPLPYILINNFLWKGYLIRKLGLEKQHLE